jgi:hypothetical protein
MQGVAQPRVSGSARSRGVGAALALCLMMGVSGAVAGDGAAPPAEPSSQRSKASSAGAQADKEQPVQEKPDARRTVRQPLRSVLLEGVPMRDAVARWSKDTGLTVVIDWDALEQENINPDAPVTLKVDRVPAAQVLRLILEQSSALNRPVIYVWQGYVEVLSRPAANKNRVTRMYDVRDLVMDVPDFRSGRGAGEGGRNGTRGTEVSGQSLTELIRAMVEPEVWSEQGGQSTIRYSRGYLIVKAPLYVQAQIGLPAHLGDNDPLTLP